MTPLMVIHHAYLMSKNWPELVRKNAQRWGLTEVGLKFVLEVVSSPPSRNVSNVTGRNLIVDFCSRKMEETRAVESATVEAGYAQLLETKIPCLGYWAQIQKFPIPYTGRDGIKRCVWSTLDFLVAYADRIVVVECKKESDLVAISSELPGRFRQNGTGEWHSPEGEDAFKPLGIEYRVVSSEELGPTLLRNYSLLAEIRQNTYSSPLAKQGILNCFTDESSGIAFEDILSRVGKDFTKNDLYFSILRGDIHALLADQLLVNIRTTMIFASEADAEVYRLINFQTVIGESRPLILKAGMNLRWNGTEYTICNASREKIHLTSKGSQWVELPAELLNKLLQSEEIVLMEQPNPASDHQKEFLYPFLKVLDDKNQSRAISKGQFLDLLDIYPGADSQGFGLSSISKRTVQRWRAEAKESEILYGSRFWGLLDKPRKGRPRDELPKEMRDEMTEIANELYFTPEKRSLVYVWRELKKRRTERNCLTPSKGCFRRHVSKMKNLCDATTAREGERAGYKYSQAPISIANWITAGDFPLKVAQMDGKTLDIWVVDDETGEVLGKPTLTLITLPHFGAAPIGMCILFEPESSRSATMALRDVMRRFGEAPKFLIVDNANAFNNVTCDKLLATLECTKVNRPASDPRFSCEIEGLFNTLDREVIHNQAGNTKLLRDPREMSREVDPERRAAWTFSKLYDWIEHYLFTMLWDAPSAFLGTTPRWAFEKANIPSPDRNNCFFISPDHAQIAFFPEVKHGGDRLVQPGRGINVEGYYYWHDSMAKVGVEKTRVRVRYDPYDLYTVYAAIGVTWVKCIALHAPELRNVTKRTRHIQVIARRTLRNTHAQRREDTHGRRLADLGVAMRADEKILREVRRARAQKYSVDKNQGKASEEQTKLDSAPATRAVMPRIDFSDLADTA